MITGNGIIGQIIHDLLLDELLDVAYYRDLEMWVRNHSRSLKVIPFESLGTVSYLFLTLTLTLGLGVKVIKNGAVRKTICDFLLVGHCKYSSILYHFRVI